jgi:chromosome segregation ATPase
VYLQVATKEKNAAEERMAKVQARLDEMQAQFDVAMQQKQLLEDDAAACQKKMDSAAALLHALAGESKSCNCEVLCDHVLKEGLPLCCMCCKCVGWQQHT